VRSSTGTLAAYLAGVQAAPDATVRRADCFTLTLNNGNAYRYNNSDVDVPFYNYDTIAAKGVLGGGKLGTMVLGAVGGPIVTFVSNAVRVHGLRFSSKIGFEVDEQEVVFTYLPATQYAQSGSGAESGVLGTGHPGSMVLASGPVSGPAYSGADAIEGVPFAVALQQHLLDYATIKRWRAFLPEWGAPPYGVVLLFQGRVSSIVNVGSTQATVKVKSDLVLLDQDMPRNTFQAGCRYTLFDLAAARPKPISKRPVLSAAEVRSARSSGQTRLRHRNPILERSNSPAAI
jgi:hypothetical protein